MKSYPIKALLMIFTTVTAILSTPKMTFAQVDYSLLTEVVKSCQEDVFSPEYYKRIGFSVSKVDDTSIVNGAQSEPYFFIHCINSRYYHLLVLSKLPWLASSGDILPGYPSAAAISLTSLLYRQINTTTTGVLECLVSQDPSSRECQNSSGFRSAFNLSSSNYKIRDRNSGNFDLSSAVSYIYMCPSCTITSDELLSMNKMTDAFIKWFFTLDKPQRREVMSILGDETAQIANRESIFNEAQRAVQEYKQARQRVEQQEQEQRKIDIFGE